MLDKIGQTSSRIRNFKDTFPNQLSHGFSSQKNLVMVLITLILCWDSASDC